MSAQIASLEGKFPKSKPDNITTYETSDMWTAMRANGQRYNPDDLVGKKGLGIYSKMQIDEQIKAVCEFKLAAILSRGWSLKYDDDSELSETEQQDRIGVINAAFRKMRGSFSSALEGIASGREYGFSVTAREGRGHLQVQGQGIRGHQQAGTARSRHLRILHR